MRLVQRRPAMRPEGSTRGSPRRWAVLFACLIGVCSAGRAQPVSPATVQPPARVDVGLRGSVIATVQVGSHAECLGQCRRAGGCTGWNFAAGSARPPRNEPAGPLARQPANCTLFSGALLDQAMKNVVSCRMPCETGARAALLSRPAALTPASPTAAPPPPDRPVRQQQGTAVLQPAPARLAAGTASASAASFGTGLVTGPLPPCPPGRPVVVAGSCSNAAVAMAPGASAPTTITLAPTHDNTIGSSSLSAAAENAVHPVNYWFATPGIGMGCNHVFVAGTGVQHLSCARGLIRFDLAALAGKTVQSATLKLTTSASGIGSYRDPWYVAASASPWAGASVTWINYGDQTYVASIGTFNPPTQVGQVFNLDQTATVRAWLSGAYVNNGFALALSREQLRACHCNSLDAFEFHSNEDAGGRGPKLIVTYQ